MTDAQGKLANRIGGIPGAPGLIAAAYQVALDHHRLWTLRTSLEVRAVAAYYESAEVRLLALRVEYMHARPKTYTDQYVETQVKHVEK